MTSDGLLVIQFIFTEIWRFFTEWNIPGTGTTPGAFLIFLLVGAVVLRFILRIFATNVEK